MAIEQLNVFPVHTLALIVAYVLALLLIWTFVGYPLLMVRFALRRRDVKKNYSFQPFISILVPTFNEEAVVQQRIQNLRALQYPKDKYKSSWSTQVPRMPRRASLSEYAKKAGHRE